MPVLVRIALRNLMEHKAKSMIIGSIIALGILVLNVGDALMDTAALGVKRGFIDNYTGHVMISGETDNPVSLFGVQSPGGIEETPTLPNYDRVREYLETREDVEAVVSQVTFYAQLSLPEMEGRSFSVLFGIDPEEYRSVFSNITFVEGRDLLPGEEGIVLSLERLEDLEEAVEEETEKDTEGEIDIKVNAGDTVRLTSFGNAGIKIREVPIVGVFEFKNPSEGLGIDLISYVDVQTLRALSGMTIGYRGEFDLDETETELLETDDLDSLFDEAFSVEETEGEAIDESSLDSILGDTSVRDAALEIDTGSWHYLLLTLDSPRRDQRVIRSINQWLDDNGIPAQAGDWEAAAGPFATTADVIRQVFNVAIIIVGIVALIIMMNTLVISVIERTSEIGTMRALGAQKGFVWRMFLVETITITTVFGIAGSLLSFLVVGILNMIGIPATNVFLRVLFAGEALHPSLSAVTVLTSLLIATIVGIAAHIYPVSVALKIAPIRAIQTE